MYIEYEGVFFITIYLLIFFLLLQGKQCGFEQVCEIKTARCYRKPCTYETYCAPSKCLNKFKYFVLGAVYYTDLKLIS